MAKPKTVKVRFREYYKNGALGVEASAGQVVELDETTLRLVREDLRYPDDVLEYLEQKKAPASAGES